MPQSSTHSRASKHRALGYLTLVSALAATTACGRTDIIADPGAGTEVSSFDAVTTLEETETTPETITQTDDWSDTSTDDWTETGTSTTGPDPVCGNGEIEGEEECDPGEEFMGPNEACLPGCIRAECGDGFLWTDEELCDDGNDNDNDACTSECVPAECGDGIFWPGFEDCDDGNFNSNDSCIFCEQAFCGDGWQWFGNESCDDGNFNNNDACTNQCDSALCGDGIIWSGVEECDDGVFGNQPNLDCTPECQTFECGDGWLHWSEQCDPGLGGIGPGMACLTGCILNGCGDGDAGPGEECDDGNPDNTDDCTEFCQDAACGDGFIWTGVEGCDDGAGNQPSADCTPACQPNVCGDGFKHVSEECDLGVDNGPGSTCLDDCTLNECGDGDAGPGEACDDGNAIDTDDCTNACELPVCGDGIVWEGNEECDDSNPNDWDACHNDCTLTKVIDLALGGNHTCVLFDTGAFRCWGNGDDGRTAQSSEEDIGDDEPADAGAFVVFSEPVANIYTGLSHSCTVSTTGQVTCFGRGDDGQLGYASTEDIGDNEAPNAGGILSLPTPVSSMGIRGGALFSCAQLTGGQVYCWGLWENARLGYPGISESIGDDELLTSGGTVSVGGTVVQLSQGYRHTCARLSNDELRCWGYGGDGALGYGNSDDIGDDETPASAGAVPVGEKVIDVSAGFYHTCAITESNNVRCWGRGNEGRLGYASSVWIGTGTTPADWGDIDLGGEALQIASANGHTCALLADGKVRCWGWAARGQLGYGNLTNIGDTETPASAGDVPVGGFVTKIAADGNHTCAVVDDTRIRCWGQGGDGRLGYGNLDNIGDDEFPSAAGDVPIH